MIKRLSRHRGIIPCILVCAVCAIATPSRAVGEDIVTVKVRGEGLDRDAAIKDALRKAVEQGGKNEIASRSKTKDFALEYDVVLTRATGLVKDHKVLSTRENNGITVVQVEAKVSKSLIDATWADVTLLLKQLGRPKIMVMFTEVIHDLERPEGSREIVQRSSILGTRIERKLLKLGFKLVNPSQIKEIDRKKAELAAAQDDVATLQSIATSYGAAIYIKGQSRASGPQKTKTPVGVLNMWETDVTIQGFWTETGDAIFSNTLVGTRGGSRVAGPPGGRQALQKSGGKLADASVYDMLEAWTRGTAGGVGDIIVEVRGVKSIKQAIKIKKALAAVKGVDEVHRDGAKGTVKFTVVTAMNAEGFVEHMVEFTFDGFELEIEDQKSKTIVCTIK